MKYNKSGFTLIEMLIAMSIFFIMVVMTYANYAYFQNIARVKLSLKEISQSINEARNMAIS
jgi:prepilin-type N-terminal cleavage/methylation domain-containing protein